MIKNLLFFIYVVPLLVFSQNSIGVDQSVNVGLNEIFEIPVSLNSDGNFIAFQTDINFNSSAFNYQSYNVDNVALPNHNVVVNLVNESTLRILVYSGSNSNFSEGNFNFLNLQFTSLDIDGEFVFNFINTVSDSVNFTAQAFNVQVNSVPLVELNINGGNINQYSNLTSSVILSNTVQLKAMQFDLILPENFDINLNSIQATQRLANHNLTVNEVATNQYRILIYSSNNSVINIGSDNLFTFEYSTSETQIGSYQPTYELTELVNENNESITGTLNIAPLLILTNSFTIDDEIDMGTINLNESFNFSIDLMNNENNVHYINQIESNSFTTNINLPSQVVGQETKTIIFNFTPIELGVFSGIIQFYHSGNESISEINVTGNVISENYFTIQSQSIDNNSNNVLNIFLKNTLPVKGFQFDFIVPNGFSIDIDNVVNSTELNGFNSQVSHIDGLKYRLLYYDTNNEPIQPNFQSLISIPLIAQNSVSSGYYSVDFSETSIVGEQNQNIFSTTNTIPQFYYSSSQVQNSYLKLTDAISERGVSKKISIELINDAVITGVQFDIEIPSVFNPDTSSAAVVSRAEGFSLSFSHISGNLYRCLIYSTSNMNIPVGDSSILELSIFVNESAPFGNYEFNFSNITLVNTNNQNSSTPTTDTGFISISETTITLIGDNPLILEAGNTFTDPGAIASDINGNDISNLIEVTGSIDINTVGSYTFTYTLSDSNGNITSSVSRIVNVIYVSAPTITLVGDNPLTLEVGSVFSDPGATAIDAYDGDLTNSIVVTGNVDVSTVGNYTLSYNVTDSSGNPAATVSRTVSIVDTTAPIINLVGDNSLILEVGSSFTDPGATAIDSYDGDLTNSIVVTGNINVSTVGTYTITYSATDASNNTVTATRTVNVVDTTAPVLTVTGDNPVTVELGASYTDAGAIADGGETVSSIGTVDPSTVGTYTITYSATDAFNNTGTATRTVNVVDTTAPIITLVGNNLMQVEVGSTFTDPGATAIDTGDGDLTISIEVTGSVDVNTLGSYTLSYNVTDSSGNVAATVTRIINVVSSLGTETNENIFLRIFPNPVQSILIIEYSKPIKRVLIYNLLGQKILEYLPNNSSVEINLINLKTGIYLLKINDLRLKKIIKK